MKQVKRLLLMNRASSDDRAHDLDPCDFSRGAGEQVTIKNGQICQHPFLQGTVNADPEEPELVRFATRATDRVPRYTRAHSIACLPPDHARSRTTSVARPEAMEYPLVHGLVSRRILVKANQSSLT